MAVNTKGIGHRDTKGATNYCFIFDSWMSSKRSENIQCMLVHTWLVWLKPIKKYYVHINLRGLKSIGRGVLTFC